MFVRSSMIRNLLILLYLAVFMPMEAQNTERAEVLLETTEGNIRIALYDETPLSGNLYCREHNNY